MAKRPKQKTPQDFAQAIRASFKRWKHLKKHGGHDPFFEDGVNMNLVRNHIFYDQGQLTALCKAEKTEKCPKESRLRPPREVSNRYCAPKSKSGPCVWRRMSPASRARILAAREKIYKKMLERKAREKNYRKTMERGDRNK